MNDLEMIIKKNDNVFCVISYDEYYTIDDAYEAIMNDNDAYEVIINNNYNIKYVGRSFIDEVLYSYVNNFATCFVFHIE